MPNILHLSKYYDPYKGGLEQVVFDLCQGSQNHRELQKIGVLCINHEPTLKRNEIKAGIQVYRANSFGKVAATELSLDYCQYLKKVVDDYDVLHIHLPNPLAMLAIWLCRRQIVNKKVIVHWHSDIVKQKFLKIPILPLQSWLLERSNIIVATSPNYIEGSIDLKKYIHKVEVIPIGMSTEHLKKDSRILNCLKQKYDSKKVIFGLGRMVYYKGFDWLIEAATYLEDDTVVLIGGGGPNYLQYQRLIEKKKLCGKVVMLGKIPSDELASYYELADVFCLSSVERSEAFGVVQLEAFSMKTPVVCFNIEGSGVPWVNSDGETGVICKEISGMQLAEAIQTALLSSKKLGEQAYSKYQSCFTRELMVNEFCRLYQR